ncbi:sn-glycerol-1-phosphate dehydrogenase [Mahella sp.]|uniref:sn-glycerol-1-phosphate dehydrogenase n=1 Tax=Mahella sp. TaxID=2798721 RepID=UPI0025BB618E|nr:sn-glycerol-1-phosphate dehydrogenase [Mahella sp.]MBZ4665150.1 Glycerol-phosphate dehydrogenase [Mahella sp.]
MYNISDLAGRSIECDCGHRHEVLIKHMEVESGAINHLPDVCRKLFASGNALLVADDNTYKVAGARVYEALINHGFNADICMLKRPSIGYDADETSAAQAGISSPWEPADAIATDERSIVRIMVALKPDTAFLLAVGSGTINDLVRFVSSRTGIPYISIPTAPSVDGYASTVVPLLMDGFKRTVPGTYPTAIIADTDVLCNAPSPMIAAGFGDMVGKLTALSDWKLGHVLDDEYLCQTSFDMMSSAVQKCLSDPAGIRQRKPDAIKALMEGLILSGIAMMLVGNSRPASGSEHHMAHYWEMLFAQKGFRQAYHGAKVGIATPVIASVYKKLTDMDETQIKAMADAYTPVSPSVRRQRVADAFGQLADEVIAESSSVWLSEDEQKQRAHYIAERWTAIRDALRSSVPDPQEIKRLLADAGAAYSAGHINVDAGLLHQTLLNAMYIRTRYTVLRLADDIGCLENLAAEVTKEAFLE